MDTYHILAPSATGSSDSLLTNVMFKNWVHNLKNASHRWRVDQVVHQALPPPCHLQLGIDMTKAWCGYNSKHALKDLSYESTQLQIFEELEWKNNTKFPVLS
jgi:hypothetical protein